MRDKLRTWRKDGFRLDLFYVGSNRLDFDFFDGKEKIFSGKDYRPGAATPIDSLAAAYGLLSFLSLKPGDTDKEYFDDYTPRQMAWVDSGRAEHLSYLVYEWEEKNNI